MDPATLGTIRLGLLLGQVGVSAVREIIAWANKNEVDLPTLEKILTDVEESERAAAEATAALLKH